VGADFRPAPRLFLHARLRRAFEAVRRFARFRLGRRALAAARAVGARDDFARALAPAAAPVVGRDELAPLAAPHPAGVSLRAVRVEDGSGFECDPVGRGARRGDVSADLASARVY
jgi:hypothetical protein